MKIAELRKELEQFPDDMEIIISKDGEGNQYSPLSDFCERMYVPTTTWFGDAYMTDEDIDHYIAKGYNYCDDDRAPEDAKRVLCLWPVN